MNQTMKEKIKTALWALKLAFKLNPLGILCTIIIDLLDSMLTVYIPVYVGQTLNSLGELKNFSDIFIRLGFIGLFLVLELLTKGVGEIIKSAIAIKTDIGARENFVKITNNIPIRKFDIPEFVNEFELAREGFGGLVTNINDYLQFIKVVVTLALALAVMVKTSIFVFVFVILVLFVGHKVRMKMGDGYNNVWLENIGIRRISNYIQNLFFTPNSAKEIKSYNGMGAFLLNKWNKIRETIRISQHKTAKKNQTMEAFYVLFVEVLKIAIVAIIIWQVYRGETEAGSILTIWLLADTAFSMAGTLTGVFSSLFWCNERMLRAKKLMNIYLYNKEEASYEPNLSAENSYVLKNARFSYVEGKPALTNINLTIKQGETIAIVGENGSGKSTLAKVLLGLYPVEKGEVCILGEKIKDTKQDLIGAAFQDYMQYPFTFRENVGFGFINKLYNDDEIKLAVKQGDAEAILNELGMEKILTKTMVNDGAELSGGQWQRIAISRANMNQKPIMIFDEPAAKLDPIAELKQFTKIQQVLEGRTAILISHRIGFAKLAGRILVVKNGEIIEDGTHEELVALNGEYKKMLEEQTQWYDTSFKTDERSGIFDDYSETCK